MTVESKPAYLDPSLPVEERVRDLISRMTVDEKISQMRNAAGAVPRLGIPEYDFWSEALHGVARNGRATVFPQAIGMAASWDPGLVRRVADAIADEGRAKYHDILRRTGRNLIFQGITFWSPNVNIFRDPRWGRGQETWGEDPYLTGEMGAAFVKGLQGDHPKYMKTAACAKHYAVHSGPERDRHTFDAVVSRRDLYATYLPAFKKLVVDAKVESVMGAYNRTLGEPCNASRLLLEDILREEWGFEGHVVSDCGALTDIHQNHKYTGDGAESAAVSLKRGCDIGCDCVFYDHLQEALDRGLIVEADIDRALERTIGTRFKLGMFDPDELVPFASIPVSVVGCEEHRSLAYEAAVRSVVLLKNRNNILPVSKDVQLISVLGPSAASVDVLLGNYNGINNHLTTLLEGILQSAPKDIEIDYRIGCTLNQPSKSPTDWSVMAAARSDLVFACMGISPLLEGEEGDAAISDQNGDRLDIGLPANQVAYVKKLVMAGAKVVLVLTAGSPLVLGELEEMVEAIVYVWYPGQEGGRAVGDVLFGSQNPSGKLPLTFPRSLDQLPPFEDYSMTGRTYRYATAEPLFPFGFGLSYSSFAYSALKLNRENLPAGETLEACVSVTNTGSRPGGEVVQVYLSDLETTVEAPFNSLVAFQYLVLEPGQTAELNFTITPEMMALVDDDGSQKLEPGAFRLTIGGCSPGERGETLGAPKPVSALFNVQ
ncbi:MAG: glycoside hydrolase family 3 protein [Chloroflexota bacterium]|nr:MAG: glycoside hydrolase family 3 protein [Chloroflexota bacterium]